MCVCVCVCVCACVCACVWGGMCVSAYTAQENNIAPPKIDK